MDAGQLRRLVQIEKDTYRLLKEARTCGWEGEAAGLETTLIHIKDKKGQVTASEKSPIPRTLLLKLRPKPALRHRTFYVEDCVRRVLTILRQPVCYAL